MHHLFHFFVFWIQLIVNNGQYKFCRWLDSNCGPLVLEPTAMPTEPQPLTKYQVIICNYYLLKYSPCFIHPLLLLLLILERVCQLLFPSLNPEHPMVRRCQHVRQDPDPVVTCGRVKGWITVLFKETLVIRGLVVSVVALYSDDSSLNPAEVYCFLCTILFQKNGNK